MSANRNALILPLALVAMMAVPAQARAQGGSLDAAVASCAVDENSPSAVQKAAIMLAEAISAKTDSARRVPLLSADKVLGVPTASDAPNAPGHAYELGRALVMWLNMDSVPVVVRTRGSIGLIGLPSDSTKKIDLSVWIDSSFSIVEKAIPSCVSSLASDWRQGPGWFRLVQRAVNQANTGQLDSASVTVTQAARIYSQYPSTSFVMAQVAEGRGDHKTAVAKFNEAIELSKQDSSYAQVRRTAEVAIGKIALAAAHAASNPDDKKLYLASATDAYTAMSKEPGGEKAAQDGLAAVASVSGDPTVAEAAYKGVLSDTNATYADLVAAGVAAGNANQLGDAIRLFRRAVVINGFQRDALSDLSILLAKADSGVAARPYVDRLLTVDPANPANYDLAQQVYASLQRDANGTARRYADLAAANAADAAKSGAYRDSATAATNAATAFGNTSLELLSKKDAIVVGVQFSQWIPKSGSVTLAGILTNSAPTAKTVTVHVDFLDAGGHTVSSSDATVTVDPKRSKEFSVTGNGTGIAAFRYSPPAS